MRLPMRPFRVAEMDWLAFIFNSRVLS